MVAIVRKSNRKSNQEYWRSLAVVGYMSLNLGIMIAGGYFLGHLLEVSYHWKNMAITGVFVGLFVGLFEMFILAYKVGMRK